MPEQEPNPAAPSLEDAPKFADDDRLFSLIVDASTEAEKRRNAAGRSELGRLLSIVATDLEKVQAFVAHKLL